MFTFAISKILILVTSVQQSACTIEVKGRVQGVGFRPYIHRLAVGLGLTGWVRNSNEGLSIYLEGTPLKLDEFTFQLNLNLPIASSVESVSVTRSDKEGNIAFEIRPSINLSDEMTEICPDIALCDECLSDLKRQPHRIDYPLINCTNCGPRFSIIRELPYDRLKTTMDVFPMCLICKSEYSDVTDRRFHAQPVACNRCGPKYILWNKGRIAKDLLHEILNKAAEEIRQGGIIALKGIGGFHLICDASSQDAVESLRKCKGRDSKPFAVMFRDSGSASEFVRISKLEENALNSWQRPIVLLQRKTNGEPGLAPALNEGLASLGVVLPYMPFHYLLMERLDIPAIVLTSGNLSEQPILIENMMAVERFSGITDMVITHQREIYNRVDDSIVRIMAGSVCLFRRARGYCPDPIGLTSEAGGILAMGAELTNAFCTGKGKRAYLSQHIGDLRNPETHSFYKETVERFLQLFRIEPATIVTDLHPEYHSTKSGHELKKAFELSGRQISIEVVQHHHAHIASCMAEHKLDEKVIGVVFDGTGLGTDGHIWGSEIMIADLESFSRVSHFGYLPMPGGDKAVEEPWRMAVSALYLAFGEDLTYLDLPLLKTIQKEHLEWVIRMIRNRVNTPLTCGAGRYFDAVASLLGLCLRAVYEGEGPMKLEALTREDIEEEYSIKVGPVISFAPAFKMIVEEIIRGSDPGLIATKFHNTVITAIVSSVVAVRAVYSIDKVVLSGGTFQNKYLVEHILDRLQRDKFNVFLHKVVPPNDGGLALGQMIIAAKRREKYVLGCTGKSDQY